jgi:hypothetical protein
MADSAEETERFKGRTIPSPDRVVGHFGCCQQPPRRMSRVPLLGMEDVE